MAKQFTEETMGQRIRRLREQLKLSQGDVAERLGVSRVAIIKYELGQTRPVRHLERLASILNTTADYLLTGRTDISRPLPTVLEDVLLPAEIDLLCKYRALNDKNRHVIDATIDALSETDTAKTADDDAPEPVLKESEI